MPFLNIKNLLRTVDVIRRFNCLTVPLKYPARPPLRRHFGNIFLWGLTAGGSICWTSAPQHRVWVLTMSCHVCYIRTTTTLIEAIDPLLKVSFVRFIPFRWFMSPEHAWLFRTFVIILESVLTLDQGSNAWVSERTIYHTLSCSVRNVILSSLLRYSFNLLQPFSLERSVLLHSVGQTHRHIWVKALVYTAIEEVVVGF